MRPLIGYLLFGVISYLIALLATVPAYLLIDPLQQQQPDLQLYGVEGSIWNTRVEQANWQGIPVGRLESRIAPWAILQARLQLNWRISA